MSLVKSKQRVADHGEVFTPAWMVEAMLDLVKGETERIDSRFLEPACGDGNFLVQILRRKLPAVELKYGQSDFERRNYAILALMRSADLDLETIILLDRVQKRFSLDKEEHQRLKRLGLVEGRYPNLLVAADIAAATGNKARHIRDKGLDNRYYQEMILKLIRTHQPVTREDVDAVLLVKLPEVLDSKQKQRKIGNLLMRLSHKLKVIENAGSRTKPQWVLAKDPSLSGK
jgi:hypothetical protein